MTTPPESFTQSLENLPFSFARFIFHLRAGERLELPEYKGSTFRGGFGHALKQVWCLRPRGRVCDKCRGETQCPYSYIFETPRSFGLESEMHAANLPHPFVLLPPLQEEAIIEPGEMFSFELTLCGSAIYLVESFVLAFERLGDIGIGKGQGKFRLAGVTNAGNGSTVYDPERQPGLPGEVEVHNYEHLVEAARDWQGDRLTLRFLTPTHLLHHGRVSEPEFEIFLRRLLARTSELAKIHGGRKWELDYRSLIDNAVEKVRLVGRQLKWQDWERFSNRRQQRMKFRGFVGTVTYQGDIKPLLPLILLGQFVHVGNKTSFGMGKYVVDSRRAEG